MSLFSYSQSALLCFCVLRWSYIWDLNYDNIMGLDVAMLALCSNFADSTKSFMVSQHISYTWLCDTQSWNPQYHWYYYQEKNNTTDIVAWECLFFFWINVAWEFSMFPHYAYQYHVCHNTEDLSDSKELVLQFSIAFICSIFESNHCLYINCPSLRESLHPWSIKQDVLQHFLTSKVSW